MGARIDSSALVAPRTLLLALVLGLLGTGGKLAAGWAAGGGLNREVVGWGMVPRGEVGLIFVAVGSSLRLDGRPLLDPVLQAGVVGALLLTTVAGPVGLGRALRRRRAATRP
jgi:Kef-type K+ transport system membrane component KefB